MNDSCIEIPWIVNPIYLASQYEPFLQNWHNNPLFDLDNCDGDNLLILSVASAMCHDTSISSIYDQVLIEAEAYFKWIDLKPLPPRKVRKLKLE